MTTPRDLRLTFVRRSRLRSAPVNFFSSRAHDHNARKSLSPRQCLRRRKRETRPQGNLPPKPISSTARVNISPAVPASSPPRATTPRFLQMLLNGGELDGVRLLSPKTVELMHANHTGNKYLGEGDGFGLGFWGERQPGQSRRPAPKAPTPGAAPISTLRRRSQRTPRDSLYDPAPIRCGSNLNHRIQAAHLSGIDQVIAPHSTGSAGGSPAFALRIIDAAAHAASFLFRRRRDQNLRRLRRLLRRLRPLVHVRRHNRAFPEKHQRLRQRF